MTEEEKVQYIRYMQLKKELDNVSYNGINLKLGGYNTSSHSIAAVCVFREDTDYMRNYVRDDSGCVAELNFDSFGLDQRGLH